MKSNLFLIVLFLVLAAVFVNGYLSYSHAKREEKKRFDAYLASEPADSTWYAPGYYQIPFSTAEGKLIAYGRDLIANTSYYLGPNGTVAHTSNGMNCQNCHLEAGTKPWGNNYGGVYSMYPQFRSRSNSIQNIYARVNDCFERSLNGSALDTNGREMQAIYAYMKWLGDDVTKGIKPGGVGIKKLAYLNRPADAGHGKTVFIANCQSCHGESGEGVMNAQGTSYTYPPLWGIHSFNDGAGLYRISNFAGYVKSNMPMGTTYKDPKLTDEEAWDVAAYVLSQPRPHKDQSADWKTLAKKPIDFPYAPYVDTFSEKQHKYGPFAAIVAANKEIKTK